MTTQLTLISVPAMPARQDVGADAPERLAAAPTEIAPVASLPAEAARSTNAGTVGAGAPAPQRRSAAYDGWLDGRTINTGRKGVAAARAALADANQRVATRREQEDAERQERRAEQAASVLRPAPHAA